MARRFYNPAARLTYVLAIALSTAAPCIAQDAPDPFRLDWTELAPGVWTGIREHPNWVPVLGNCTFVVGGDGVLVFDGGGWPLATERVIEKVREVTDSPITHLVISHWHQDHSLGLYRIVEEFPDATVISHSFTHAAIESIVVPNLRKPRRGFERLFSYVDQSMSSGLRADSMPLTPQDLARYDAILQHKSLLTSEGLRRKATVPTVTFEDRLVIHLGDREVQLRFLGVGNTEGDVVMWLPRERIVAAGDLVVFPTPYAFNTYPRKWARTLEALNGLGYEKLVPGHGAIQSDSSYVSLIIETLDSVADQTDELIARGFDREQVGDSLDFARFDERFLDGDSYQIQFYKGYFTDPLRRSAFAAAMGEVLVKVGSGE